ncbi:hypothetical protein [Waltera sp.]|uniref:hypothetical protein n=1 Tax=Waltera sp. TaxID=2815806 RepID=UPI003995F923
MMATNSYFNENSIEELLDEIKYVYQSDRRPWVIGYSGGKDSTKLIETQQKMGYKLITQEELKAIDEIWDDELDLSRRTLVELYEELTGEKLPWYQYKEPLIDEETIEELERLAAVNDVPFDLVRNIILSVYHNKNYSNQRIMKDALERLLNQQWLHHEILKEIEDENK